ncbi:MAG: ligand-binding sensor domain-containing protein, partial [Bryobacteraceae bacterium]
MDPPCAHRQPPRETSRLSADALVAVADKGMRTRIAALLVLTAMAGFSQDPPLWRFWDARDGLPETYTRSIGLDGQGRIWTNHGTAVDQFGVNDGYRVRSVPVPGNFATVLAGSGGVWAATPEGLWRLENGAWRRHVVPLFDSSLAPRRFPGRVVAAQARGRVFLLTPQALLLYRADTGKAAVVRAAAQTSIGPFTEIIAARDGGVWIMAERGIGKIDEEARQWQEYSSGPVSLAHLRFPSESSPGVLTVTGDLMRSNRRAIVRFEGGHWRVSSTTTGGSPHAWEGAGNSLWIQDGNSLIRESGGKRTAVGRSSVLSGSYYDAFRRGQNVFWVATGQGVARHALPLWSPPPDGPDEVAYAIVEDRGGRIWFASSAAIFCLDGAHWRRYPTAGAFNYRILYTGSLMAAPDGRIVYLRDGLGLAALDPASGRIESIPHPSGRIAVAADTNFRGGLQ